MGQAVCRLCLNLSFSDVFLIVRLGFLGFGGTAEMERPSRRKVIKVVCIH